MTISQVSLRHPLKTPPKELFSGSYLFPPRVLQNDLVLGTITTPGAYAQPCLVEWRGELLSFASRDTNADFADAALKYWRSTDRGLTWGAELTLTLPSPDSIDGTPAFYIALHGAVIGAELYVLVQSAINPETANGRYETYLYVTSDLVNWTRKTKIQKGAEFAEVPSSPIKLLEDGTWVYGGYTGHAAGGYSSHCWRSSNNGVTWVKSTISTASNEVVLFLRPGGQLVAITRPDTDGQIGRAVSNDNGLTWSAVTLLNVPATYSSQGAWGTLTEDGTLIFIGRTGGNPARFEKIIVVQNCLTTAGTAAAYDLPVAADLSGVPRAFGGSLVDLGDGRIGCLRAAYVPGGVGPSRLIYNELAWNIAETATTLLVPDALGLDSTGKASGLLRGAASFADARMLWDAQASRNGWGWARQLALTTVGGQYRPAPVQSHGYRESWEQLLNTNNISCGAAADWTFLHNGLESYYIALAGFLPTLGADVDLLCSNGSTTGQRGIRLWVSGGQWRLMITKGDGVNSHTHAVSNFTSGWYQLLWHVSPTQTTQYLDNGGNRAASSLPITLVHSTSVGTSPLILGNNTTIGTTGVVGSKLTDIVIVPGSLTAPTTRRLFAWLARGKA